ncbi:hypothetical protein [Streptomyces sp. H27-D2]|uniref:hypothetical protein n=1 Tax=Streptomyces sp. H27-D2 TaxID=3046304 RepID=UPI002DBD8F20|nr:hypothetical protein [Streptomyces sp. H27-D2]MEC4019833.1 hypothetical protein [Streptomyces sp. H27-D2]
MATDQKQLNVRVGEDVLGRIKDRAAHQGMSVQAYVSGLVEQDVDPARDAFVAGLSDDMAELLGEFETAFEAGQR